VDARSPLTVSVIWTASLLPLPRLVLKSLIYFHPPRNKSQKTPPPFPTAFSISIEKVYGTGLKEKAILNENDFTREDLCVSVIWLIVAPC
jgi:hypothetical protein